MNTFMMKRLNKELDLPKYETDGSVGIDTYVSNDTLIASKGWALIPLGLVAKAPEGTFIAILPRSSTFRKTGLLLANSVGVVDQDYCGDGDELMAFVYNTTDHDVTVKRGDRLFQLLLIQVLKLPIEEVEGSLADKSRGGFGSTDNRK